MPYPDDTETKSYISYPVTLTDMLERIKAKWPNANPDEIDIAAEHIQIDGHGHDQYDSSDWIDFLVIECKKTP